MHISAYFGNYVCVHIYIKKKLFLFNVLYFSIPVSIG